MCVWGFLMLYCMFTLTSVRTCFLCIHMLTCSSVLRSPNSCMKVFSEGKRAGSRKWSKLKSSSTVFWRGVPVSRTLCSWKEAWEFTIFHGVQKYFIIYCEEWQELHTMFWALYLSKKKTKGWICFKPESAALTMAISLWVGGICTRFMSLKPSSSLQFLFLRRWASSMITQRHSMALSSGQPPRIISNVVITAWNL